MKDRQKLTRILHRSKEIFSDCLFPNGSLVAAPSHMPYYPKEAKSYLFCWPGRDAGFNLLGALRLGSDEYNPVLTWIWERQEDYREAIGKWREGLIFQSYHPNGRMYEASFQPDQTGTLLWSIFEYSKTHTLFPIARKIVEKSTDALIRIWDEKQFKISIQDIWEEIIAHPRFQNNLTYSLAACAKGLECAHQMIPNSKALKVARQMRTVFEKGAYDERGAHFSKRFGGPLTYHRIVDASLLGLVWPFETVKPQDVRMLGTIQAIERELSEPLGIYRYQFDHYEGEIEGSFVHYKMGAGAWPLLSFWMSIVFLKMGERKKAEEYFWKTIEKIGSDSLIPEQFFPKGDPRVGVKPLLWSHMMCVHAAYELGYLST